MSMFSNALSRVSNWTLRGVALAYTSCGPRVGRYVNSLNMSKRYVKNGEIF